MEELSKANPLNIEARHRAEFASWFKEHVSEEFEYIMWNRKVYM